jgi:hypothetical protein
VAGRTPAEVVNNFLDPLHKTISCVTQAQLNIRGGYFPTTTDEPHALTLADGLPQRLSGPSGLSLVVKQYYYVIKEDDPGRDPWRVRTAEYNYNLRDIEGKVVIAYHWHPAPKFKVRDPHLHLEQGAKVGRAEIHRAHIPTGRVAVEDVIRFVITEFGVEPLRADWDRVLADARATFREQRTWA